MCDKKLSQLTIETDAKCQLECKNGGKCQINSNGVAQCKCEVNLFKGEFCQIKVILDTCSNDLCLNGGSCLANGECLCPPGYAGERCQTKRLTSQCGLVTCYNGGTCFIDNQNEYACMCHHVFTGRFCETKLETTTSTSTKSSVLTSNAASTTVTLTTSTLKKLLLNNESTKHVTEKSGFSLQEIFLIVLAGIGMPVFSILIVILLYRINANRKLNDNLKQDSIDNGRFGKIAVENIYVECNNNNNKNNSKNSKNIVIQIEDKEQIDLFNSLKKNDIKQSNGKLSSENNIYSFIDFSNENLSKACVINSEDVYASFNKKNVNLHEHQVTLV